MTDMKLPFKRMLNSHLVIRLDEFRRPPGSRIVIPEKYQKSSTKGNVVAIADDITDIKLGDKVLISQFAGYLLAFDGLPLLRVVGYTEVLGILHGDSPDLSSEGA